MKNYYEILEVDIHASDEIIEKAFKVLAKKYHPDTQEEDKKQWAEEQFKLLNEAYEVLSDKEKRESYTKELEFDKDSQLQALLLKNADLEVQVEDLQAQLRNLHNATINQQTKYNMNNEYQYSTYNNEQAQAAKQAFYQNYASRQATNPESPYTQETNYYESYYHPIKHKLKNLLAFCLTVFVIFAVCFALWKIPYTHNILVNLYEDNYIIHAIVNLFYK